MPNKNKLQTLLTKKSIYNKFAHKRKLYTYKIFSDKLNMRLPWFLTSTIDKKTKENVSIHFGIGKIINNEFQKYNIFMDKYVRCVRNNK